MDASTEKVIADMVSIGRQVRLERELLVWRSLLLVIAAAVLLVAARPQSEKEIRLVSTDGKNVVSLSSEGLILSANGKPLAQLSFITVGDGDHQQASLKLSGQISVESGIISVGSFGKQRVAIRPEGLSLHLGAVTRATLTHGLLSLADPTGRTTAEMSADEKGLTSLILTYDRKVIAELGSEGNYIHSEPPKRNSSVLLLNDFGAAPKSRMISPSGDETHGQ